MISVKEWNQQSLLLSVPGGGRTGLALAIPSVPAWLTWSSGVCLCKISSQYNLYFAKKHIIWWLRDWILDHWFLPGPLIPSLSSKVGVAIDVTSSPSSNCRVLTSPLSQPSTGPIWGPTIVSLLYVPSITWIGVEWNAQVKFHILFMQERSPFD